VGRWASLDGCEKSRPPPGFDSGTVQPVASRCTDYVAPAQSDRSYLKVMGLEAWLERLQPSKSEIL